MTDIKLSQHDATLTVEWDFDSSSTPKSWVWLMVNDDDTEPWFRLTIEETRQLWDALAEQLIVGGEL